MTSKSRMVVGIVLILVAPLVSFLLILAPVKGLFFIVFLVPGVIVLYGIYYLVSGARNRKG